MSFRAALLLLICVLVAPLTILAQTTRLTLADSVLYQNYLAAYTVDAAGNSYFVRYTPSGSPLVKIGPDGRTTLYSTPLVGFGASASTANTAGELFVIGYASCETGTACVPISHVFGTPQSPSNPGGSGVGILKLSATGSILFYDVFPAGAGGTGVATDAQGNIYVAGSAQNCTFPISTNAVDSKCLTTFGNQTPFLVKLSADGQSILYSTFLGGTDNSTSITALAVDGAGNAYVAGSTGASDYPVTPGAYLIPNSLCVLSKIDPTGSRYVYSSRCGNGTVSSLALDASGAAYITGRTQNGSGGPADYTWPTTAGVVEPNPPAPFASFAPYLGFVTKINSAGSALVYSTYLAWAAGTYYRPACCQPAKIRVDAAGAAYVAGGTEFALDTPISAAQNTNAGKGDAFLLKLNPQATAFEFATYFGGPDTDQFQDFGIAADGSIYAAGSTIMTQLPAFAQIGGPTNIGSGFVAHFRLGSAAVPMLFVEERTGGVLGELKFGPVQAGTTATLRYGLGNYGAAGMTIRNIAVTGDYSQTNNCPAVLGAGEHCDITVTFAPRAAGERDGTLTVSTDASGGFTSGTLTGSGTAPTANLSTKALFFGVQAVGTSSAPQVVTITNSGTANLTFASIVASGDFTAGNDCGTAVPPGGTCQVSVVFKPTATGQRTGTVTLTDTALDSPQTITLTGGVAPDFSVTAATGGSMSQSVTAGQTANYALSLAPAGGFTGTVALSCSGAPTSASCVVTPSSLNVSGTAAASFTVSVTTAVRSATIMTGSVSPSPASPAAWLLVMLFGGLASAWFAAKRRRIAALVKPLFATLLLALLAGCGGGGSSSPKTPVQTGTPAGTYTIVVTAASGSTTHSQNLTLVVQ